MRNISVADPGAPFQGSSSPGPPRPSAGRLARLSAATSQRPLRSHIVRRRRLGSRVASLTEPPCLSKD